MDTPEGERRMLLSCKRDTGTGEVLVAGEPGLAVSWNLVPSLVSTADQDLLVCPNGMANETPVPEPETFEASEPPAKRSKR